MADEKRRQPDEDQSQSSELSDQEFTFPEGAREDKEGFAISEEEVSETDEGEETAA